MDSAAQLTRRCTKCGEEKALEEFHKCKRGKFGVTTQCKACTSKSYKERYANDATYRERQLHLKSKRRADDDEFQQKERQRSLKRLSDPSYIESEKLRKSDPDFRRRMTLRQCTKAKQLRKETDWYSAKETEYKKRWLLKRRENEEFEAFMARMEQEEFEAEENGETFESHA